MRILFWLSFLLLPLFSLANESCHDFYSNYSKRWDMHHVIQWKKEVSDEVASCPTAGCLVWPKSFSQKFGMGTNNLVTNTAARVSGAVQESMATIEKQISSELYRADLDTVVQVERQNLLDSNPVNQDVKDVRRRTDRMDKVWQELRGKLDLSAFRLAPNIDFIDEFQRNFAVLREKYDSSLKPGEPELLTREVMIGAGYSNLGSGLLTTTTGQKFQRKAGLDAFTILHPLTDNAIDKGIDVSGSMKKITEFLDKGTRDTRTETKYEGLVLDLIHTIFVDYPREKHPLLVELLKETHKAQLLSSKLQKDPNTPIEKLIETSIHKCGVTVLSLVYILKGGLTRDEAAFFYRQGALVQMGDDLVDISIDMKDGIRTVWTNAMGSKAKFKTVFQAFLNLQSKNEQLVEQVRDQDLREGLRSDIDLGFKMFMLSAFMNPMTEKYVHGFMKEKIPLSPKNVREVIFNSYYSLLQTKAPNEKMRSAVQFTAEVLDMHFWGNQYKEWEAKKNGKKVGPYRALSFMDPSYLVLKFENAMTKWGGRNSTNSLVAKSFVMAYTALIMSNMVSGHAPDSTWENVRAINNLVAMMSTISFLKFSRMNDSIRLPVWGWVGSYSTYIGMLYIQNFQNYFP